MSSKFCKNSRCSASSQGPCSVWEECDYFLWDSNRQAPKPMCKAPIVPREEEEQRALFDWCKKNQIKMIHIPNERKCSKFVGYLLSEAGVQKGFPDNFIPYARNGFHGLFIELKRQQKSLSKVSKEQSEWLQALCSLGYKAVVCYGAGQAIEEIKNYFKEK